MLLVVMAIAYMLAVVIVNAWYQFLMKMTGSSAMYMSAEKKFKAYFVVSLIILMVLSEMF